MAKACAVCGKPSGMYFFCASCNQLKAEGKIKKCEECGIWHKFEDPCKCNKTSLTLSEPVPDTKEEASEGIRCLICDEDSNGQHFCKKCYYKYRNKSLLVQITKCKEFKLRDESYEGIFTCTDGHVVKSKSEREIDNFFYNHNIRHIYEKKIIIEGVELHPDFYLPDQDVYLEHWGYDEENEEYTKTKNYKIDLYEKEGITVICTHEKTDTKELESNLEHKLRHFEKGKVNFKNS